MPEPVRLQLEDVPAPLFTSAVTYLKDVLRECQLLTLSPVSPGAPAVERDLKELAEDLVPYLEEIVSLVRAATYDRDIDRMSLSVEAEITSHATMALLRSRMAQLRFFGDRGDLLVEADPPVVAFLDWVWAEFSDQMLGRRGRPYPVA